MIALKPSLTLEIFHADEISSLSARSLLRDYQQIFSHTSQNCRSFFRTDPVKVLLKARSHSPSQIENCGQRGEETNKKKKDQSHNIGVSPRTKNRQHQLTTTEPSTIVFSRHLQTQPFKILAFSIPQLPFLYQGSFSVNFSHSFET